MQSELVARSTYPGWCFVCGRSAEEVIVIYLPCPHCTVPVPVRLCKGCARELAEAILQALEGERK